MKVSKAQAQANRAHVVETASQLFRERGFDGVGVADLMAAAGFTHGGFYKQFGSKADLIAESTACGIGQTIALADGVDPKEFVKQYLSRRIVTTVPSGARWPHWVAMLRGSLNPSVQPSRPASRIWSPT
jgi:AcrR family transcriptional regulator